MEIQKFHLLELYKISTVCKCTLAGFRSTMNRSRSPKTQAEIMYLIQAINEKKKRGEGRDSLHDFAVDFGLSRDFSRMTSSDL